MVFHPTSSGFPPYRPRHFYQSILFFSTTLPPARHPTYPSLLTLSPSLICAFTPSSFDSTQSVPTRSLYYSQTPYMHKQGCFCTQTTTCMYPSFQCAIPLYLSVKHGLRQCFTQYYNGSILIKLAGHTCPYHDATAYIALGFVYSYK